METSTRRLGRDTAIYALAFVLQRAASFIMLPIYTRYFTTADYGVLQLLQTSVEVASILFSAGITAGVHRFYFQDDSTEHRNGVLGASFVLLLGFNAVGGAALALAAPWVAEEFLGGAGATRLVRIASASFCLDALLTLPMLRFQAEQRSMTYATLSVLRLVIQLTMNVLGVVVFDLGVEGILWSTLLTHVVLGTALTYGMLRKIGLRFTRALLGHLYRFGLPYRLTAAGAFALTYGDRYFLEEHHGLAEVGVYSLAYQFGFLLMSLGPGPFHLAWDPQRFQLVKQPKEIRDREYARGFFFFALVVVTLAVGISVFVRPLLTLMSAPEFHRAADLVPLVLLAFLAQSFGEVMDFGIQVSGRTLLTSLATFVAVVVIVGLYAWLIPSLGGTGAALATLGGFTVRGVLYRVFAEREYPIDYRSGRAVLLVAIGGAVAGAVVLLAPQGLWNELGVACVATGVYAALVLTLVMRPDERAATLAYARSLRGRLGAT